MANRKNPTVYDCSFIELPKSHFPEGNLTYIYNNVHLHFEVKRVFWNYNVPEGKSRGAHAHKQLRQLLIAIGGSFTVNVDDGIENKSFLLDNPYKGLLVEAGEWSSEDYFSPGAVCLVLCDDHYDENDYIRNYDDFKQWVKNR
mgnify:CR=1 FL=1